VTQSEEYVANCIRTWVWSGFHAEAEMEEMIEDVIDEDCDVDFLQSLVKPEFRRKLDAQATWPEITACDRLDKVFYHLHEDGICALANAGYTMSDGHTDVTEVVAGAPEGHYHGYCFYHGQDVERAVQGQGLSIAFGDLEGDPERDVQVGHHVRNALQQAGFVVEWDGTRKKRIDLPSFDWKRRGGLVSDR
jgi:hypothetical protein